MEPGRKRARGAGGGKGLRLRKNQAERLPVITTSPKNTNHTVKPTDLMTFL
jgi:hypothetical protein